MNSKLNIPSRLVPQENSNLSTIFGIVAVIAGLYFGRLVLIPLALAVIFSFLLEPLVTVLERVHLGRVLSVVLVLALSFSLLGALGWKVTKQIVDVVTQLPGYKSNIRDKIEHLHSPSGLSRATASVTDLSKELSAASGSAAGKKKSIEPIAVQVAKPPRTTAEYIRDVVGPFTSVGETLVLVVILTLFMLIRREDLRNRLLSLAGNGQLNIMTQAFDDASRRLRRYLLSQFLINILYGLLFGSGLLLLKVPHAMLWGALSSLLRFVPYIGTPIGALFPMLLSIAVFPEWTQFVCVGAWFLILEITIANVVEPWWYGAHTGVSPLAILIAAIFWGLLWGPVGLIVSTPLTVCLMLIGRYVPQLSFLEVLLGDEPVLSPDAHFYQRLLALDDEESRDLADNFLKEGSLEALYDSVFVPALRLAEVDRHMNALDDNRAEFVYRTVREFVDEIGEDYAETTHQINLAGPQRPKIICVPAKDKADEIVAVMCAQILRLNGFDALAFGKTSAAENLDRLEQDPPDGICVSALPPHAGRRAKVFCRVIRKRQIRAKLILGLWNYDGGRSAAQERVGSNCADDISLTLQEAVAYLHQQFPEAAKALKKEELSAA